MTDGSQPVKTKKECSWAVASQQAKTGAFFRPLPDCVAKKRCNTRAFFGFIKREGAIPEFEYLSTAVHFSLAAMILLDLKVRRLDVRKGAEPPFRANAVFGCPAGFLVCKLSQGLVAGHAGVLSAPVATARLLLVAVAVASHLAGMTLRDRRVLLVIAVLLIAQLLSGD